MEDVLAAQRRYFDSGATRPLRFRREMLTRLELALTRWEGELLEALKADLNKSPYEGYMSELGPTLAELRFARGHLKKWARPVRHPAPLSQFPSVGTVYREPYGVSLILAPWNYPLFLTLAPLVSAIAAGSTAVVKPGEDAPASARALAEVLGRVFPPEYITVAEGGREEAEALVDKPFDVIFFTGSPAVGKKVMAAAAEHLTPVTLELGGRSPVILAPDADVELAAARIAWGKFLNAGQTCVAPDHVWVPEGMAEPFVAALARQITRFYGENPLAGEGLPRIVNRRHFDRLAGLLSGGRIAVGGQTDPEGLRIAPTVLVDVPEGSPVLEEEIFGPILPVLLYRSLPEGSPPCGRTCRSWWRPRGRSPARWPSTCSPGAAPSSGRCWRPCPSGAGASTTRWCTWPTPASPSAGWGTAAWAPATAKRASTPSPTKRAYSKKGGWTFPSAIRPMGKSTWAF